MASVSIILCLVACLATLCDSRTVHLYVSPSGSDNNDGHDPRHPMKTLEKARQRLSDHDVTGNTVYVELMRGHYDLPATLHFTSGFSHPVTFRAYQDQEVHVTGGKRISSHLFHHVSDSNVIRRLPSESRNKVLQVNLRSAGVTNFGHLTSYGFYASRHAALEVFINGNALRLAQWPNEGYIDITETPSGRHGKVIRYKTSQDSRWVGEKDPWAYGYWYYGWSDNAVPIKTLDSHTHTITLAKDTHYGVKTGQWRDPKIPGQGGYFRVINMLSELDQPGEYYVDKDAGILYLWPNTKSGTLSSADVIYVSIIDSCIKLDQNVHNLNFEGFTIENCRFYGIEAYSVHDITVESMELKNTGSYGFHCAGDCRSVTVSKCEIHHGDGGVSLTGGDRKGLVSSGNLVEDNHIWEFSRVSSVGMNGVSVDGVNLNLRYNHIHHGQYTAVRWGGNDHVMEYNHVHHLCMTTSDCGAIHAGRDWTFRGNVIRYNHIHHTLRFYPGYDTRGIMLDDQYSSVLIDHNVFYDNDVHANIGGGRDNIISNNVFYNATSASVKLDSRGLGHSPNSGQLFDRLRAVPYTSPVWKSKYPELANINQGNPNAPEGNQIFNNIFYNNPNIMSVSPSTFGTKYFDVRNNKKSHSSIDFWAPDDADFRLRCLATEWANSVNFQQPITVDKIGPRHPTGPKYLHTGSKTVKPVLSSQPSEPCASTVAPATAIPRAPYLPDGSDGSGHLPHISDNIPKYGCWLVVTGCPSHPHNGTHRDTYGEQQEGAGTSEDNCLARAAKQWTFCGSSSKYEIYAVYGPTGATTVAGAGCYMAQYGCPAHGGDHTGIFRDVYAEQHVNAAHNEKGCLARAAPQWRYCGSDFNYPIVSIYRPTGAVRVGGAGCWIKVSKCPADPKLGRYFYDAWGATNLDTDNDRWECEERATDFWQHCGSHRDVTVTAYFRPSGTSKTVP